MTTRPCPCCGLDNAIFSPSRKAPGGLPTAFIVCDLCVRHQGSHAHDLKKAVALHREMWSEHERERIEELTALHGAEVAARDETIAGLREELEKRPIQVVEKWVDADELHEAHEKATSAYRSRDHAFRQLCLIHIKHHEISGERCSCGKSIAACDVVGVIEGFRGLLHWEYRQEQRMDEGRSHQLPREYVKFLGKVDSGYDEYEFDPYDHDTGS